LFETPIELRSLGTTIFTRPRDSPQTRSFRFTLSPTLELYNFGFSGAVCLGFPARVGTSSPPPRPLLFFFLSAIQAFDFSLFAAPSPQPADGDVLVQFFTCPLLERQLMCSDEGFYTSCCSTPRANFSSFPCPTLFFSSPPGCRGRFLAARVSTTDRPFLTFSAFFHSSRLVDAFFAPDDMMAPVRGYRVTLSSLGRALSQSIHLFFLPILPGPPDLASGAGMFVATTCP